MSADPATDTPETSEKPAETPEADAPTPASSEAGESPKEDEEALKPKEGSSAPVVSPSKRSRPPYKYDPNKITLRFLFANRDGLTVTVECNPTDTIGEVKGALLSVWPEDLPSCSGGDRLRLICMGKGILMPDSRTLEDCEVPVFKTHPTPINVAVRPENVGASSSKGGSETKRRLGGGSTGSSGGGQSGNQAGTGCGCAIM